MKTRKRVWVRLFGLPFTTIGLVLKCAKPVELKLIDVGAKLADKYIDRKLP